MKLLKPMLFLSMIFSCNFANAESNYKFYPNSTCNILISLNGEIQSDGQNNIKCIAQGGTGTIKSTYDFQFNNNDISFTGDPNQDYGSILIVNEVIINDNRLAVSGECSGRNEGNMRCIVSMNDGSGTIQAFSSISAPPPAPPSPPAPTPLPSSDAHSFVENPNISKAWQITPKNCIFFGKECTYSYYLDAENNKNAVFFISKDNRQVMIIGETDATGGKLTIESIAYSDDNNKNSIKGKASGYCYIKYLDNNTSRHECNITVSKNNYTAISEGPFVRIK